MDPKSGYGAFFKAARQAARGPQKSSSPLLKRPAGKKARPARPSFPLGSVFAFLVSVAICGWALWNLDVLESWAGRLSVGVFSSASAEEKTEKTAETAGQTGEKKADEKKETPVEAGIARKGLTEEQVILFSKLDERKRSLDQRERELERLDAELQKQKVELDRRLSEMDELRKKITSQLQDRISTDKEKVALLVEVYSGMKPQNAAKIMEQINEDLAVDILGQMKKKSSAEILGLVAPEKAQKLSEKLAGYKRD